MSITALGTDMPGTPGAYLLTANTNFYLVGAPEGTQRYCAERGHHFSRPGRLRAIVLPQLTPAGIMGLPSLYMGIADNLATPNDHVLVILVKSAGEVEFMQHWWGQCRVAFKSESLELRFEHTEWADEHVKFRLNPDESLEVTFAPKIGTFLPEEATRLGVPKQRFAELKAGTPVHSEIAPFPLIEPAQALGPQQDARRVLFCTHGDHIRAHLLRFAPNVLMYTAQSNADILQAHDFVRHQWPSYLNMTAWYDRVDCDEPAFLSAACIQRLLHARDPCAFPIRDSKRVKSIDLSQRNGIEAHIVRPELTFTVFSAKRVQMGTSAASCVAFDDVLSEIGAVDRPLPSPEDTDPAVYILGSSCATPSIYRNVSSALIVDRTGPNHVLTVVDCGEGSLGQLSRLFEPAVFFQSFHRIRVAITHGHADHHFGAWSLVRAIGVACPSIFSEKRFALYFPELLLEYAHFMLEFALRGFSHEISEMIHTLPPDGGAVAPGIRCARVLHSADPFGYVFTVDGMDLVFSGDTRPAQALINAGKGAAFLLHEATFLESEASDAVTKMHSTVAEAIGVQREMQAWHCLLTHFSTKYIKRTGELIAAAAAGERAACAIDFARIDVREGIPAVLRSDAVAVAIEKVRQTLKGMCGDNFAEQGQ